MLSIVDALIFKISKNIVGNFITYLSNSPILRYPKVRILESQNKNRFKYG